MQNTETRPLRGHFAVETEKSFFHRVHFDVMTTSADYLPTLVAVAGGCRSVGGELTSVPVQIERAEIHRELFARIYSVTNGKRGSIQPGPHSAKWTAALMIFVAITVTSSHSGMEKCSVDTEHRPGRPPWLLLRRGWAGGGSQDRTPGPSTDQRLRGPHQGWIFLEAERFGPGIRSLLPASAAESARWQQERYPRYPRATFYTGLGPQRRLLRLESSAVLF